MRLTGKKRREKVMWSYGLMVDTQIKNVYTTVSIKLQFNYGKMIMGSKAFE